MTNKNNYKPSTLDTIQSLIIAAEYIYMSKCMARGVKNPIPFRTMMKGYTYGCILVLIIIAVMVMK